MAAQNQAIRKRSELFDGSIPIRSELFDGSIPIRSELFDSSIPIQFQRPSASDTVPAPIIGTTPIF